MEIQAALVHEKGGAFQVEAVELAEPQAGEVLVRMVATGLCHTDLVVRDQMPLPAAGILGHEGAGIVERVGAGVSKVKPGDHVVLSFSSCGTCPSCQEGKPAYCHSFGAQNVSGKREDGSCTHHQHGAPLWSNFFGQSSFATYALARQRNVVKVPAEANLAYLGPLGCGFQTGAGAVLNSLKAAVGSSIAVFGLGAVGFSAVMAAKLAGCSTIVAVDINPQRLELALQLGATHIFNSREGDPIAQILALTGRGADYVIEATGIPDVMASCIDALHTTGVAVLLGVAPRGTVLNFKAASLLRGVTIKGVIEGDSVPDVFIPKLVALFQQGLFPIDHLIRFYPLAELNQAVADMKAGSAIKPVLTMTA